MYNYMYIFVEIIYKINISILTNDRADCVQITFNYFQIAFNYVQVVQILCNMICMQILSTFAGFL